MQSVEILLAEIRAEIKSLREIQDVKNQALLMRLDEHERLWNERLTRMEEVFQINAEREHKLNGAMWMLSVIGGGVLSFLGAVGYTAVHGVPQWIKRVFDGALTG